MNGLGVCRCLTQVCGNWHRIELASLFLIISQQKTFSFFARRKKLVGDYLIIRSHPAVSSQVGRVGGDVRFSQSFQVCMHFFANFSFSSLFTYSDTPVARRPAFAAGNSHTSIRTSGVIRQGHPSSETQCLLTLPDG
jgi:hypothetical protein